VTNIVSDRWGANRTLIVLLALNAIPPVPSVAKASSGSTGSGPRPLPATTYTHNRVETMSPKAERPDQASP
jgi:hypothetical protein